MTDEQIIKALERCFIVGSCSGCAGCPLKPKRQEDANCIDKLVTNTIALINRQQAEIDRLKAESKLVQTNIYKKTLESGLVKEARTEAIKEFAKKLKENYSYIKCSMVSYLECSADKYVKISHDALDNLVAELVGDSNA